MPRLPEALVRMCKRAKRNGTLYYDDLDREFVATLAAKHGIKKELITSCGVFEVYGEDRDAYPSCVMFKPDSNAFEIIVACTKDDQWLSTVIWEDEELQVLDLSKRLE